MNATATARFPLDGLLRCGQYGAALRLETDTEPHYVCPGKAVRPTPCAVPAPRAKELNCLLIGEIARSAITGTTIPRFRERFAEVLGEDFRGDM